METYVVAVSIDKVQSFLYHTLRSSLQENQSNSGTLKSIIESSLLISNQFYRDIGLEGEGGKFSTSIDQTLLKSSGKCIFTTTLTEEEIIHKLDELFQNYYLKSSGKILLKYTYFLAQSDEMDDGYKLHSIKESNRLLKQSSCLNRIIERNKDLVFDFWNDDEDGMTLKVKPAQDRYDAFVDTINALYDDDEAENENRFRIAVVKADLDGMGDLFKSLGSYEAYQEISHILSTYISLDFLHSKALQSKMKDPSFRMYPLYIAGDDIFFALPIAKLVEGVYLCESILNQINQEIKELKLPLLTMSVGIEFTFNREPIRYYYERVESQLDYAKQAPLNTTQIPSMAYMKICINHFMLYHYQLPSELIKHTPKQKRMIPQNEQNFKQDNDGKTRWNHFVSHVKRIQEGMEQGFAAHHFFYGLLDKITDSNIKLKEIQLSNTVLYHLIPQFLNSPNRRLRELELLILESTMKQVMVQQAPRGRGKPQGKLNFKEKQRGQLEGYVRLLLLFSDPRFRIIRKEENQSLDPSAIKRVRSMLFNKSLQYLFDHNLGGWKQREELRNLFVVLGDYIPSSESTRELKQNPNKKPKVYRTLHLSSSLLYRIKKIKAINRIADMLAATNPQTHEEIMELESLRKEEYKAPPGLSFDRERFLSLAQKKDMWTDDYIDSLLIFYKLREQLIQLRTHPAYLKKGTKS